MKKKLIILLIIIFMLVGVACFLIVLGKNSCTEKINAKVVDIVTVDPYFSLNPHAHGFYNHNEYYPIVEYVVKDEIIKTKCYDSESLYKKYQVDDEIEIYYNPKNIKECKLSN